MTPKRVDANQPAILRQLRQTPGILAWDTHVVGRGYPDICVLVLSTDRVYLVEIKMPCAGLTDDERKFHASMDGCNSIFVAHSYEEILRHIGILEE